MEVLINKENKLVFFISKKTKKVSCILVRKYKEKGMKVLNNKENKWKFFGKESKNKRNWSFFLLIRKIVSKTTKEPFIFTFPLNWKKKRSFYNCVREKERENH